MTNDPLVAELLAALLAVTPPNRALGCWCPHGWDNRKAHTSACYQAQAARLKAER